MDPSSKSSESSSVTPTPESGVVKTTKVPTKVTDSSAITTSAPTTAAPSTTTSTSVTTSSLSNSAKSAPLITTTSSGSSNTSATTTSSGSLSSVTISIGVSALQTPPKGSPPLSKAATTAQDAQLVNPLSSKNKTDSNSDSKTETTKGTTTSSTTTTTSSASATGGMKRPASGGSSETSSGSAGVASEPPSESESDLKKKKMRKDAPKDTRTESSGISSSSKSGKHSKSSSSDKISSGKDKPTTVPPTTTDTPSSVKSSSSNMSSSKAVEVSSENPIEEPKKGATNNGGQLTDGPGPKVPPLKIVLQSFPTGTALSAPKEKEEAPATTTSSSSFPYIVSSTTGEATDGKETKEDSKTILTTATATAPTSVVENIPKETTKSATATATTMPSTTSNSSSANNPAQEKEGKGRKETISPPTVSETAAGKKGKDEDKEKEHGNRKEKPGAASIEEKHEKETNKETKDHITGPKEKPTRVTRSSHRILEKHGASHTPNSPSSISPKTSACPSPTSQHGDDKHEEKMDTSEALVELHPRKRKLKNSKEKEAKEPPPPPPPPPATSSANAAAAEKEKEKEKEEAAGSSNAQPQNDPAPMMNCFEMWFNIRKQIARRRRNLFPVTPKPPKGFKDYLMNRGTYVLQGNPNAQMSVPLLNPPSSLNPQMKATFVVQEKGRHKLRLQHLVEKEKLVLAVEQEILRVHGRAARALSNQTLPFSVCTILKDEEVYNLLTPEQEEKDITARSRYNGRLFLSWLQDVDDKWDKIKEQMLLRHHNEAESLHAVQKMDWEWKLKEFGLCEPKAIPFIEEHHVSMVHVSDDFDLLPA